MTGIRLEQFGGIEDVFIEHRVDGSPATLGAVAQAMQPLLFGTNFAMLLVTAYDLALQNNEILGVDIFSLSPEDADTLTVDTGSKIEWWDSREISVQPVAPGIDLQRSEVVAAVPGLEKDEQPRLRVTEWSLKLKGQVALGAGRKGYDGFESYIVAGLLGELHDTSATGDAIRVAYFVEAVLFKAKGKFDPLGLTLNTEWSYRLEGELYKHGFQSNRCVTKGKIRKKFVLALAPSIGGLPDRAGQTSAGDTKNSAKPALGISGTIQFSVDPLDPERRVKVSGKGAGAIGVVIPLTGPYTFFEAKAELSGSFKTVMYGVL